VTDTGDAPTLVRPAGEGDLPALSLVGQATFLETYAGLVEGADIVAHCARQHSVDAYRSMLGQPRARAWLAETRAGRAPVGYLVLTESTLVVRDPAPGDLEVRRIYLLGRFQGTGTGRALMDAAFAAARELGAGRVLLGVYSRNTRAIAFYEKAGYRPAGERRFQVGSRQYDDVILARGV
jgi:diamine N-acetyltransferase